MRNRSESRKKRKAYVGEGEVVGGDDNVVSCEDEGDEDSEEKRRSNMGAMRLTVSSLK